MLRCAGPCCAVRAQDVKDSHEEAANAAPHALRLCQIVSRSRALQASSSWAWGVGAVAWQFPAPSEMWWLPLRLRGSLGGGRRTPSARPHAAPALPSCVPPASLHGSWLTYQSMRSRMHPN